MPRIAPTNLYVIADCHWLPATASGCANVSMRSTSFVLMKNSASTTHRTAPIAIPAAW